MYFTAILKGVGPATASAILAAAVPENFCFYADEVAASIPALRVHNYHLRDYKVLNSEMVQLARRLNAADQENQVSVCPTFLHSLILSLYLTTYCTGYMGHVGRINLVYFFSMVEVDAEKWTPHRVELAVWTYYLLYNHNQDALNAAAIFTHTQEEAKNSQRKKPTSTNREEEEEEGNTEDESASQKRIISSDEEPLPKKLKV